MKNVKIGKIGAVVLTAVLIASMLVLPMSGAVNISTNETSMVQKIINKNLVNNPGYKIPPLLFIPLVENAFKHGISSEKEYSDIFIQIHIDESEIELKTKKNQLFNQKRVDILRKGSLIPSRPC